MWRFPYIRPCTASPTTGDPSEGTCAAADEPAQTRHRHLGPQLAWGSHLGLCHSSFTARNILCPPLTHPSFPRLLTTTGPLSVPKALPFPECHVVGIAQMGCFRLAVCIYSSSVSLRGRQLICLALSTVPLPGGTTTCPSPAEGKGIVVASKLHQLWIKPP